MTESVCHTEIVDGNSTDECENSEVSANYTTNTMKIRVATLTGKMISLEVSPHDTVADLSRMVQVKEGIPPNQQIVIYRGTQISMNPSASLAECGLEEHSIVHLALKLRGAARTKLTARLGRPAVGKPRPDVHPENKHHSKDDDTDDKDNDNNNNNNDNTNNITNV